MSKKNRADAAMAQGRLIYMLELARGSSHIASTRTPETLKRAISEVMDGFCQVHGAAARGVFQALLSLEVGQRGHPEGAQAVSAFASAADGQKKAGPARDRPVKSPDHFRGETRGQNLREQSGGGQEMPRPLRPER
jgi:hypothetical protein